MFLVSYFFSTTEDAKSTKVWGAAWISRRFDKLKALSLPKGRDAVTGPASLLYAVTGPASLLYAVTGATGCFAGEGSHKGSKLTKDWEAVDRGCEMFTGTEMTVVIPLRLF